MLGAGRGGRGDTNGTSLLSTQDVAFVGTFALYTHLLFLDAV